MNLSPALKTPILPIVFDRECGGWLAVAPEQSPLRIGVTADTEQAARDLFDLVVAKWCETLERKAS